MYIDILVSKLVKKGFTKARAEKVASELTNFAKQYSVNIHDLLDEVSVDFKLNDLGEFITNNALKQGYLVGRVTHNVPNKYVSRAIIK